jgi:hypothetical protein
MNLKMQAKKVTPLSTAEDMRTLYDAAFDRCIKVEKKGVEPDIFLALFACSSEVARKNKWSNDRRLAASFRLATCLMFASFFEDNLFSAGILSNKENVYWSLSAWMFCYFSSCDVDASNFLSDDSLKTVVDYCQKKMAEENHAETEKNSD